MGQYKDIQLPEELDDVIAHMRGVDGYREELAVLGQAWDLLTILGQMTGGGADMTTTREAFKQLTEQMIGHLGHQTLTKTVQDIGSKSQVAIDLIIRNLFERTADIGFLATDDDIRNFLSASVNDADVAHHLRQAVLNPEAPLKTDTARIVARFQDYVTKYSVYHNIILLDTQGNVLAQLDDKNPVHYSTDPLLNESLQTQNEYVETFRCSDLLPNEKESLIYSYRVTETNQPGSRPLGVLCLCFRFDNEMKGIFDRLSNADDWSVITLLDKRGKVIASNSPNQIPVGSEMERVLDEEYKIVKFSGRRYIAKTMETNGYQGFFGLGWLGHVMLPLDVAFESTGSQAVNSADEKILNAILNSQKLFSEDIQAIPRSAEKIQSNLDRTVWNGNIVNKDGSDAISNNASKVLLWEISNTGLKTKNVFERSIENLYGAVVSTYMSDVEFMASLAVDIMDRNLYERANDCRWWALTSEFCRILGEDVIQPEAAQRVSDVLVYINDLYTVYTNLFVYDKSGKIIAVSNPSEQFLVGSTLNQSWVSATVAIKDSQQYSVSPFDKTSLYDGEHTYVYNAAIKDINDSGKVLGGIGIVFDSKPEFKAMLEDSLPRNERGELVTGCFGVFTDCEGNIISSTNEALKPGEKLKIDPLLLSLKSGASVAKIIEYNDHYYAVGIKSSGGYREFKSAEDQYSNEVFGFVFQELDSVESNNEKQNSNAAATVLSNSAHQIPTGDFVEIASFYIGDKWYGLKTERVVEAVEFSKVTLIPGTSDAVLGSLFFRGKPILILNPGEVLGSSPNMDSGNLQVVVIKAAQGCVGIVVDRLGEIPKIETRLLGKDVNPFINSDRFIDGLVKPDNSSDDAPLLIILNPDELCSRKAEDDCVGEEMQVLNPSLAQKAS